MDVHTESVIRLNLGAGRRRLDGYVNVDISPEPPPDIIADVRALPLPDGYADEILAVHLFEHLYRWEAPAVLAEWKRVLKPQGLLVLEMPDIMKCCRAVLGNEHPRQGMWGLFGDPTYENPLMCHRWAWSENELRETLLAAGFSSVRIKEPKFHKPSRDMRAEARL